MKIAYPVIITTIGKDLIASVPDCEIDTHGSDLVNAIEMARDAISIWCISMQDEGYKLPNPSDITTIKCNDGELVTLVDVDLAEYRKSIETRTVRKNLTLPSWLNERAERANINFSSVLQRALKEELQIAN